MRKPDSINPALMRELGRRVRGRRVLIERDQRTFAERVGFHKDLWGRIERGQQNVSISTLAKIAAALHVDMSTLLGGVEADAAAEAGSAADGGAVDAAPHGQGEKGVEQDF